MSGAFWLELLVSLTLQAAVLTGVMWWWIGRLGSDQARDRAWSNVSLALLALAAANFLLPHLRLPLPGTELIRDSLGQIDGPLQFVGYALVAIWVAGVAVSLARLARDLVRGILVLWAARPFDRLDLAHSPSGMPSIRYLVHDHAWGPFCWQFHTPAIVLPRCLCDAPPGEVRAILRHEMAHLQYGHPLALFVQHLALAIFWFHPLVWWTVRQSSKYREFVCDAAAAGSRDETADYLRGLLRLAQSRLDRRPVGAVSVALAGDATLLAERAARLEHAWKAAIPGASGRQVLPFLVAALLFLTFRVPIDPNASWRSAWSPWPKWSAQWLHTLGVPVRDYEIDNRRFSESERHPARPWTEGDSTGNGVGPSLSPTGRTEKSSTP